MYILLLIISAILNYYFIQMYYDFKKENKEIEDENFILKIININNELKIQRDEITILSLKENIKFKNELHIAELEIYKELNKNVGKRNDTD